MKQNLPPETEQTLRADVNLHEALRRRHADEPQLPEDFAQRLQARIRAEHEKKPVSLHTHRWRNMAAALVGVLLVVGGLAFAAVRLTFLRQEEPLCSDSIAAQRKEETRAESDSITCFRNTRLDSLLLVVGSHYRHAVVFIDEEPQSLRFSIDWNHERPLADFLATINEFEGLQLTAERDTLYVESVEEEREEDEP